MECSIPRSQAELRGILEFCPERFDPKMVRIKAMRFSSSLDTSLDLASKTEMEKSFWQCGKAETAHAWSSVRLSGKAEPQLTLGNPFLFAFPSRGTVTSGLHCGWVSTQPLVSLGPSALCRSATPSSSSSSATWAAGCTVHG